MKLTGRDGKLLVVFRDIIYGKRKVATSGDAKLFLEAVTKHVGYPTAPDCLQALFSSPSKGAGGDAVQKSTRADLSSAYIKTYTLPFIRVLADAATDLSVIAEGEVLRQFVQWILEPPTLWQRLVPMFLEDELRDEDGEYVSFAWLVHERLMVGGSSDDDEDILIDVTESILASDKLANSRDIEARTLGHSIAKLLKSKKATRDGTGKGGAPAGADSPGGRHDNDSEDIRQIKIYPTNDELMSVARPFYRRTDEIFNNAALQDPAERAQVHIDNQFRLLREDMLAEIREDLKGLNLGNTTTFPSPKAQKKKNLVLGGLKPLELDLGDEYRSREVTLTLSCANGLHELQRQPNARARELFLERNKNYLKHQAVGVFVREVPSKGKALTVGGDKSTSTDEIIAFACVDRNVKLLSGSGTTHAEDSHPNSSKNQPVVSVRFPDNQALGRVLLLLKDDTAEQADAKAQASHVRGNQHGKAPAVAEKPKTKPKHNVRFVVLGSAVFSYEYVLEQLRNMDELALDRHIVCPDLAFNAKDGDQRDEDSELSDGVIALDDSDISLTVPTFHPIQALQALADQMMAESVASGYYINGFRMEQPQIDSLAAGLTQPLTVIQGPPGTGKSFIGAQIAKLMVKHTATLKILVITYTNHALDQFLEDLEKAGIASNDMARLGSKSTASTQSMLLSKQGSSTKFTPAQSRAMTSHKVKQRELRGKILTAYARFKQSSPSGHGSLPFEEIMELLEFSESDYIFFEAFQVPEEYQSDAEFVQVGHKNRAVQQNHLFNNWRLGKGPGLAGFKTSPDHQHVWAMSVADRRARLATWTAQLVKEQVADIESLIGEFDACQQSIDRLFKHGETATLKSKRIVACTTTAAAKYHHMIRSVQPDVVLVEEAGEILESHVLAALASSSVKQLILIGDHQQLRPRYNNYALTVEKGSGYNFNMSMFERLIKQGCPFVTLQRQHRMHRDISIIARALTYPSLLDGPGTGDDKRKSLRGLRDRLIFMNHEHPELQNEDGAADRFDPEAKTTRSNAFEAEMCLKVVRYLAQQGYGTSNMVILTPYVGQLRLLVDMMEKQGETDPILNDLDTAGLLQAGLMTNAAAKASRGSLRISTIDNYQGEESDIVIASLTRSNAKGEIGFMAAPERLNVLTTRARECLVLIGNMTTFLNSYSDKGKATWTPFFDLLNRTGHLYDGIPVRCDRHPEATSSMLMKSPQDFDMHCPEGGCAEPCGMLLSCGVHKCQRRCHRITDHSKVPCTERVSVTCDRGHTRKTACSSTTVDAQTNMHRIADHSSDKCPERVPVTCERGHTRKVACWSITANANANANAQTSGACPDCVKEDRDRERQIQRDLQLEEERLARQAAYAKALQDIDDEIAHQRLIAQNHADAEAEKQTLAQKKQDLKALKEQTDRLTEQKKAQSAVQKKKEDKSSKTSPDNSPPGSAQADWVYSKQYEGAKSDALDKLMQMIGLEDVKQRFLSIKNMVDTAIRQGLPPNSKKQRYGCSLLGNPGTGKTTVARLLADFLASMGVIPGRHFEETTGAKLANDGVTACIKMVDTVLNAGGGVIFIDEAYQMTSGNSQNGAAVLDYLLPEVENQTGNIVFLLAGYDREMESFFAHNPGLPSRFPEELRFADYTDGELLRILTSTIDQRYDGAMKWDVGPDNVANGTASDGGLYMRVVARRIGRGRGKPGFGNARDVQNTVAKIVRRQADRLRRERRARKKPDDFFLTKEDIIGPQPANALAKSTAWKKLNGLIGAVSVKQSVQALVDSIEQSYHRELAEQAPIEYSLNKVFLGNPGTGKTTVAKLYGQILGELGLLSSGKVLIRNPSDFVDAVLGGSEKKTKGILAASLGKVLVIDEAYALFGGNSDGTGNGSDPYKTAVIDTIVAEVQSVPGDDRCVLLLGYTDQLETMFQNVNPGLARRFPIASGFVFEDFSDAELGQILNMKLAQQSYTATDTAKKVALEVLSRARNRPNFGNAGEVDILLDAAKARHQKRLTRERAAVVAAGGQPSVKLNNELEPQDVDENFGRADADSQANVRKMFEGTVGAEDIMAKLEGYQETVRTMRLLALDAAEIKEAVPFNFIFRGPPGTGKTTTARRMGKVFYDMGFLATDKVTECSASDLIGQYVGHTAKKVVQQLDKALGQVLFIDEAYRLAEGHFAKEAIDEIVDCVTKERYQKKMIIIMAGYERDMNRLLSINEGLSSRFTESINFAHLTPDNCLVLLRKTLERRKDELAKRGITVDLDVFDAGFCADIQDVFTQLMKQASWANSRDVKELANTINKRMLQDKQGCAAKKLVLSAQTVHDVLGDMLGERGGREANKKTAWPSYHDDDPPPPMMTMGPLPPTNTNTSTATATNTTTAADKDNEPPKEPKPEEAKPEAKVETRTEADDKGRRSLRDAGVSDAVWEQLQKDKEAEEERERAYQQLLKDRASASNAARDAIVRRLVEEKKRRQEEAAIKAKIATMGICPMGYAWLKQSGGWRCAGGSHYLSDAQLA